MTSRAAAWTVRALQRSSGHNGTYHGLTGFNSATSLLSSRAFATTSLLRNKPRRPSSAFVPSNKGHDGNKHTAPSKAADGALSAAIRSRLSQQSPSKPKDEHRRSPVPPPTPSPTKGARIAESNKTEIASSIQRESPVTIPANQRAVSSVHVDYVRQLSNITSPICIYQAPPQRRFAIVSYASMLFFVAVAKFNYNTVIEFASVNMWAYAYAAIICSMYGALSLYCGLAPQKMIRSIYAVPSASHSGPLLEVTFKPILPFQKATPVPLAAADLTRDSPVASAVEERFRIEANEKLRFTWGKSFFKGMRGILFDVVNMFTRKHFVYVSLPRAGQCKIELPGAVNLGRGQALEQLVHLDLSKKMLFRKMIA